MRASQNNGLLEGEFPFFTGGGRVLAECIREFNERSLVGHGHGWDEVDEKGAVRVRHARQGFNTHVGALTLTTGVVATDGSGGCSDMFDEGQVGVI